MKQRIKLYLFVLLVAFLPLNATAYDFMVDGIAYNYNNDGTTVTVTSTIPEPWNPWDNYNYIGLISADIPSSVTHNGNTYSVTSIGDNAFYDCRDLTSLTIPDSVTSIGNEAFSGCCDLESIVVNSGNTVYDSRDNCNAIIETATNTLISGCKNTVIPNSVTSIGNYAFENFSCLFSIIIPNSVTSIGDCAFLGCNSLTSITIPNSVISIGSYAFEDCSCLSSINIPNSVTSIGECAFMYCYNLSGIYNYINHPTDVTLGCDVFYGVNKTNCTLYVLQDRYDEYSNADQWKDFVNIIDDLELPVIQGDVNSDDDVMDITALIDIIMNDGTNPCADVNQDGDINVMDITAIIDIIMNN